MSILNEWRLIVHLDPSELAVWEDVLCGDLVCLTNSHHLIREVFVSHVPIPVLVKPLKQTHNVTIQCINSMGLHY